MINLYRRFFQHFIFGKGQHWFSSLFNKPPQESPVVDAWGGMRRSFSERRGEANSHREGIDRYQ
jgi:hypothetical protein